MRISLPLIYRSIWDHCLLLFPVLHHPCSLFCSMDKALYCTFMWPGWSWMARLGLYTLSIVFGHLTIMESRRLTLFSFFANDLLFCFHFWLTACDALSWIDTNFTGMYMNILLLLLFLFWVLSLFSFYTRLFQPEKYLLMFCCTLPLLLLYFLFYYLLYTLCIFILCPLSCPYIRSVLFVFSYYGLSLHLNRVKWVLSSLAAKYCPRGVDALAS